MSDKSLGDVLRVRMAPSPTGSLHIGTARTSLYNYLAARHSGGQFVLRIEDTDVARSSTEAEGNILEGLHWLGITWDEGPRVGGEDIGPFGPYRQSQRLDRYVAEAQRLLDAGLAYHCYCTADELETLRQEQERNHQSPRYNGRCRNLTPDERAALAAEGRRGAIRFAVPPAKVRWNDLVRGEVEFDNALLGDFVIVRADGSPLYNLTVVVDDAAMEIDEVIRGEDHISNTPKQIALYKALGYELPRFAHIPLILNPDRTKMSKRKSQTSIDAYREQGYLPEALVNFLAFLGWSPGTEEEIFSLDELAERFQIIKVHKGGAIFNRARLDHLNSVYIRALSDEQLVLRLRPWVPTAITDEKLGRMVPLLKTRLIKLSDVVSLADFVWESDDVVARRYEPEQLCSKKVSSAAAHSALEAARRVLATATDANFVAEDLERRSRKAAAALGMKAGDFFGPLRMAITGRPVSPPLFDSLELLGQARALARIDAALAKLQSA